MTKADRDRGVRTEQLLAGYLRSAGYPNAERAVRTGITVTGRIVADPGDIHGTPGLVWQAKGLRPLTAAENKVPAWLAETEAQRVGANADLGVLVVRRDQRPAAEWFTFVPIADLYSLGGVHPHASGVLRDRPRADLVLMAARLYLGDLVQLLRASGYGDPVPSTPDAPVAMTALP